MAVGNNMNMLKALSKKAEETARTKAMYGMTQEEAQKYGYMKIIPLDDMIEDPDNREVYGEDYQVEGLAEAIRTDGFQSAVIVYPYNGKYRIQSGHRSVEAAKLAGLDSIPAIITKVPSDTERRRLLVMLNMNTRTYTPVMKAREIRYLYETYEQERKQEMNGKRASGRIRDLVAKDAGISAPMVERYRNLLKISSSLQSLVEKGYVPWTAAANACTLNEKQQEALYQRLSGELKLRQEKLLTKKEVEDEIAVCRTYLLDGNWEEGYQFDRSDTEMLSDELKEKLKAKPKPKKVNKKTAIEKGARYIRELAEDSSYIKDKDAGAALDTLREMKKIIEAEIIKLENTNS